MFKTGVGYSGFVKKDWELVFDTSKLSDHPDTSTVGHLDGGDVSLVADPVWHESIQRLQTTWTKTGTVLADSLRTVSLKAYKDYADEVDAFAVGGAAQTQTAELFKQAGAPESTLPPKVT